MLPSLWRSQYSVQIYQPDKPPFPFAFLSLPPAAPGQSARVIINFSSSKLVHRRVLFYFSSHKKGWERRAPRVRGFWQPVAENSLISRWTRSFSASWVQRAQTAVTDDGHQAHRTPWQHRLLFAGTNVSISQVLPESIFPNRSIPVSKHHRLPSCLSN